MDEPIFTSKTGEHGSQLIGPTTTNEPTLHERIEALRRISPVVREGQPDRTPELFKGLTSLAEHLAQGWRETADRLKKRNRTSSAKTMQRNVEICDKRARGASLRSLAKWYHLSKRSIEDILKQESHWREELAKTDVVSGD